MSDDDKSMDVQFIYNQRVETYNKFRGMNPMGLISLWDESLDIIALHTVKKSKG